MDKPPLEGGFAGAARIVLIVGDGRSRPTGRLLPLHNGAAMTDIETAALPLDRDVFLRSLVRELAGTLEEVVGLREAAGYISVVGRRIGEQIDRDYKLALGVDALSRDQVGRVLVDLKRRIQGDFYVIEESERRIVFGNRRCPFAEKVIGRPSMCMMTSNVFGAIAAENLSYAKASIEESIAQGHSGCRVVLYLDPAEGVAQVQGREYFRTRGARGPG